MAERPAATLLHLGPGLGNGTANLHNARRARTPLVNLVGDPPDLPPALRRAAHVGHRRGWRGTPPGWVRTSASTAALPPRSARGGGGGSAVASRVGVATLDTPRRRLVGGNGRALPAAPVAPRDRHPGRRRGRRPRRPQALRSGEPARAAHRRAHATGAWSRRRAPRRRRQPGRRCWVRRSPHTPGARGSRVCRHSSCSRTSPRWRRCSSPGSATSSSSTTRHR